MLLDVRLDVRLDAKERGFVLVLPRVSVGRVARDSGATLMWGRGFVLVLPRVSVGRVARNSGEPAGVRAHLP